jgi:glycosyltransferase involved in cell wall biosynthesis
MSGRGGAGTSSPPLDADVADIRLDLVVEQLRRAVPGGIGTYCRGLIDGLATLPPASRPVVTLRASRPRGGRGAGASDPLSDHGLALRCSKLPSQVLTRMWAAGAPFGWLDGRRRRDLTLVHGTSFATPPVRSVPMVLMVHDLAWRRFPDAFPAHGRAWHEHALRRLVPLARAIVVPSELTAADLRAAGLEVAGERIRVIPEGVDHLAEPDVAAAAALLARHAVRMEDGYLLAVGTLEPRKNLRRVFEAYTKARAELPQPWPLVVAGPRGWSVSGGGADGVADGVVPIGEVAGGVLTALYRAARSVCYVPVFEGFGLPAAEAMSQGAPAVVTHGLPSAGEHGIHVDPEDVATIADAMVRASVDGSERDGLIAAGRQHAAALTWRRCAYEHVRVWAEVASR